MGLRATLSQEPVVVTPTPTVAPTATPTPPPLSPEELRIRNRELKDTAGISLIAYVSESEGCVPVYTRTVGQLKKGLAIIPSSRVGPIRFVVSTDPILGSIYSIGAYIAGSVFSLLQFEKGLVPAQPLWMLENTLINNSDVAMVSVDSVCADQLKVFDGRYPWGSPDLPLLSTTDVKLPLKEAGDYPDAKFAYRTELGKEYLNIKLGVNVSKILGDIAVAASEVTSVEWMLGRSRTGGSYANSYPLSDWQPLNLSDFLAGNINIEAGSFAARVIYHFRYGALALRVNTKKVSPSNEIYVLNIGDLCAAAYSRTDGAAYHNALFNDLTHPEWNNFPSIEKKTGCAFIGAK